MSGHLSLALSAVALLLIVCTVRLLQKGRIPLKYSLIWFCVSLILVCCAFLPDWLINITKMLGFQTTSNLVIGILFVLLFVLCMILTVVISAQSRKIVLLVQEISILKSSINGEDRQSDE